MKTNMLPIYLIALFLCLACNQEKVHKLPSNNIEHNSNKQDKQLEIVKHSKDELGNKAYSDSMVQALINEAKPEKHEPIDTIQILQSLDLTNQKIIGQYDFNLDSIHKYEDKLSLLKPTEQRLFGAEYIFACPKEDSLFNYLVVYNQDMESHFSPSFHLIAINKNKHTFSSLLLAEYYANEQGTKTIA